MKNIDRLAQFIAKNGAEGILIHSIAGTQNWIIGQKLNDNAWLMTLCDPSKNITYNLGTISNKEHLNLWEELIRLEVEYRVNQIKRANKK